MKRKELKELPLTEFIEIIDQIKTAYEFESELLELSRKYINKNVLFDYMAAGTTYLTDPVFTLLNKVFHMPKDDDLFSWWFLETEFGKKFKIGDLVETKLSKKHRFREPDLSTVEGLYDYCVWLSERYNREGRQ